MTREDISSFLVKSKDKTKEEVLTLFVQFALAHDIAVDKIGKQIADLRSYPEWKWGD